MLSKQNMRNTRRKAAQRLPFCIDNNPVALNFSGFRIVRLLLHFRLSVSLISFQSDP
jgi:hypothetical protein